MECTNPFECFIRVFIILTVLLESINPYKIKDGICSFTKAVQLHMHAAIIAIFFFSSGVTSTPSTRSYKGARLLN